MRLFQLRNIGIIESADIELNGLTLIAGYNDIGKSFIGKSIFSVIKTINSSEREFTESKIDEIQRRIDKLYFNLRGISAKIRDELREIKDFFHYKRVFIEQLNLNKNDFNFLLEKTKNNLFLLIKESIDNREESEKIIRNSEEEFIKINNAFNDLISLEDKEVKFINTHDRIIKTLFQGQINNKFKENLTSELNYKEGELKILNVEIKNNETNSFSLKDEFFFQDATFIESPIIMHLSSFIKNQLAFSRSKKLNENILWIDLLEKISQSNNDLSLLSLNEYTKLLEDIKDIINGNVSYNLDD